jgi:holin-like protein
VLAAISTLLLFQFIGEALATLTHVPVPGPLIGMLLLLAWLMFRGGPSEELESFGRSLLKADWWRIALAIAVSTALGLATTGWLMDRLTRLLPGAGRQQ